MLPKNADTRLIGDFTRRGVVGLRLDMFKLAKAGQPSNDIFSEILTAANIAKPG
jgi:hypothetical protein